MNRHDPHNPAPRVAVIRGIDSVQVGTMPAAVGMHLAHGGTVMKVNDKSLIVGRQGQSDTRETGMFSVYVTEAKRFGFNVPKVSP